MRDISSDLRTIVVQSGVPGLIAGIVDRDGLVAYGVAGVRRKGSPSMIAKGDQIHLGSCTKAMTATLVAMLVEDGTLSWSDTLGAAYPELLDTMDPKWRNVTITQLMTHSAGMPHDLHIDGLWDRLWYSKDPPFVQRMALARGLLVRAPEAEPGRKYIYSNAGYAIAGSIAERAAGKPWETLMRERIFEPLGMASAGFGAPGTSDRLDQPRGHNEEGESVEPGNDADNPPAIAPAGAVHCTLEDWAKFVRLHLDAAMGEPRLLSAESFRTLQTPANNLNPEYAMGWGLVSREWAGGKALTHNGTNTLWFCAVWMAPQRGFAAMAACNQGGKKAEKTVDEAIWMLAQQQLGLRAPDSK